MFALESEMIPIIHSRLPSLLGNPISFAQADELPVNSRIVDIVAAPINEVGLRTAETIGKMFSKLSMVELDFISLFAKGDSVSIHYLCNQTFMSASVIHHDFLDHFVRLGLVIQISRYNYKATNWVEALPPHLIAIEAKLSKWQEALEQAVSNKGFSSISFVALAKDNVVISRSIRNCYEVNGIGLLVVDYEGHIEEIVSPKPTVRPQSRDGHFQMVRMFRDLQKRDSKSKWRLVY